jgi:serine phosphatase RsbU (regulator of sigma subunit)
MISKILKILVLVVGIVVLITADMTYDQESIKLVKRNHEMDIGEMVELLAAEVKEFMNGMECKDDLTLLIARVKE